MLSYPKIKTKVQFPLKIKSFLRNQKIKILLVKKKILQELPHDLLDKNYKITKLKEVLIIVNGIFITKNKRIFISPKIISKKKPFKKVSWVGNNYSIYYLIYKRK